MTDPTESLKSCKDVPAQLMKTDTFSFGRFDVSRFYPTITSLISRASSTVHLEVFFGIFMVLQSLKAFQFIDPFEKQLS
jgi:hypothetical protein